MKCPECGCEIPDELLDVDDYLYQRFLDAIRKNRKDIDLILERLNEN